MFDYTVRPGCFVFVPENNLVLEVDRVSPCGAVRCVLPNGDPQWISAGLFHMLMPRERELIQRRAA